VIGLRSSLVNAYKFLFKVNDLAPSNLAALKLVIDLLVQLHLF
jgi:hypothetical protein